MSLFFMQPPLAEAEPSPTAINTPRGTRYLTQVLARAENNLVAKGRNGRQELLALYKRFLKIEGHRLRLRHHAGGGGREICRLRVDLLDVILRHIYEYAVDAEKSDGMRMFPLAIIAVGGYGRGELNPFSDVDILFLRGKGNAPAYVNAVIEQVLYLLWDVGFRVGHATRTIQEALTHANADMISKTSMLEARYVAGDRELAKKFKADFITECVAPFREQYLQWRLENQRERHAKFGGSVFMQEPNIKNGCGGLRDYHNLLWVSYFKEGIRSTAELVARKIIPESDKRELDRAYDFLLRVRTELHYFADRSSDSLTLHLQGQIAKRLRYPQKTLIERSEAFMRDYYQHTRAIYRTSEFVLDKFLGLEAAKKAQAPGLLALFKRKPVRLERFDGFYVKDGKIFFEERSVFNEDPFRLMRVFQAAQQRHLDLSVELQQLIRRRVRLVDRTFQYARAARETFFAILSRKGQVGRILRLMHENDFLGRYIPEFGALTCLVQHEFFHRYTADEHTLVCIEKLDQLIDTDEEKFRSYQTLFQSLEDPFVLYLALLLHDTGKANPKRGHAEMGAFNGAKVAARLQLSPDRRKQLVFLIDNHMLLSEVAQRRNIEEEATIASFAAMVKNQENLDALMLLTLADGQGTSDQSWSDWKETLVWRVYHSAKSYLAEGHTFFEQRKKEREELQVAVTRKLARDYREEIAAHFQFMPQRYFQACDAPEIVGHLRLFRSLFEKLDDPDENPSEPVFKWIARPDQGHTEVWICTWDRHDLLSRIAAAFAVAQVNILSADIFTRLDNLVIDIFRVCDTQFGALTHPNDIARIQKALNLSLHDSSYDFKPLLAKAKKTRLGSLVTEVEFPTRIVVSNDTSPACTVVEIRCPDRLALLHDLLGAFSKLDITIVTSRISTEKGAAFDSFYVTDEEGAKIESDAAIARLTKTLSKAIMEDGG
ncbi:MAG TPA: [protein-PII] uridylyltransferase [Chthoniobacterales bacterium]